MFEEAQLYAPVTRSGDGEVTVHLDDNHPGAVDPAYRSRRNALAAMALAWQPGDPLPVADYTQDEHEVWRIVCAELHRLHERLACELYLEGKQLLGLPEQRIPQLAEVNDLLTPLTGFRYVPAAGLVRWLISTGCWPTGVPFDAVLAAPLGAAVHAGAGRAARGGRARQLPGPRPVRRPVPGRGDAVRRVETAQAMEFISKVFWFSLEFGLVREHGEVRCYGAGLLSSFGEIQQVARADLRPLDVARMGVQTYDITHYQPILFCANGFGEIEDVVGTFFGTVDDETVERLLRRVSAA